MDDERKSNVFWRATGERLKFLDYTTGTNQGRAIQEILDHFNDGVHVVIFPSGSGSGKSIVGIETCIALGSGYLVVPRKIHQDQYADDYSKENSKLYVDDGERKEILTVKGKSNYVCMNGEYNPDGDLLCNSTKLPCNSSKLKGHQKLEACPHYVVNRPKKSDDEREYELSNEYGHKVAEEFMEQEDSLFTYQSITGKRTLEMNEEVCTYHKQFVESIETNIVILNTKKLAVEIMLGRLPKKPYLNIDEFDAFFDELVTPAETNITSIYNKLNKDMFKTLNVAKSEQDSQALYDAMSLELKKIIDTVLVDKTYGLQTYKGLNNAYYEHEASMDTMNKEWGSNDLYNPIKTIQKLLENKLFSENDTFDSLNYIFNYELKREGSVMNFTYKDDKLKLHVFSGDGAKKVEEIFKHFDHILLMSATKQFDDILRNFYGLKDFKVVKGERMISGEAKIVRTGWEIEYKWSKDRDIEAQNRKDQLSATNNVKMMSRYMLHDNGVKEYLQVLMHIISFGRLPKEYEIIEYKGLTELLDDTIKDEKQEGIRRKSSFKDFKEGKVKFHKSTTMDRAIDLPDDLCRGIILQKRPYPHMNLFHKYLKKVRGEDFMWKFMNDHALRTTIQMMTRGLRHKEDWCLIFSPDKKAHELITQYLVNHREKLGINVNEYYMNKDHKLRKT